MARRATIQDEQLLAAAREVFLEKGVSATTAEVAKRAGCAEGSIFKRFKTKQELFRNCMAADWENITWLKILRENAGKGNVDSVLFRAGLELHQFFHLMLPVMMMTWSNTPAGKLPKHLSGKNPPPLRALAEVTAYFAAEVKAGNLAKNDAEVLARIFMGSVHFYAFTELLVKVDTKLPPDLAIRELVNVILSGAAK